MSVLSSQRDRLANLSVPTTTCSGRAVFALGSARVIALALSIDDSVLIAEGATRTAASGTLGVIRLAADQGLTTLADGLDRSRFVLELLRQ
jgi:predicted nucleic acid-binding protein